MTVVNSTTSRTTHASPSTTETAPQTGARSGKPAAAPVQTVQDGMDRTAPRPADAPAAAVQDDLAVRAARAARVTRAPSAPREPTAPVHYTVKPGDSLGAIASDHDTTVKHLMRLNPQITDPDVIQVGDRITIRKGRAGSVPHEPEGPAPGSDGPRALPKGIPNTEGMSEAQEFALYSRYVEKHGDAKAKADLASGKRVILGLRDSTPFTSAQNRTGTYDDRIVVMWKDPQGKPHVEEFQGNTEPSRRWADDPSQSTKPVGRLVANQTYHYRKSYNSHFGGNILAPDLRYGVPAMRRDTNRDHRIDGKDEVFDGSWGGQGVYFHRGGPNGPGSADDTYSAGCQTMDQGRFNNFWAALGSQSEFSYVLASVH